MSDASTRAAEPAASDRPTDFAASWSSGLVTKVPILVFVVAAILRSIRPLQEAIASGGRDSESVFFAILTPALIVLGLCVARVSPFVRARRLRQQFPGALVTTGQWARETSSAISERAGVSQFSTYSLVIDHDGIAFYDGRFRGELVHRIGRADITWINSQTVQAWQRSQRGLLVATRSAEPLPLLIVDFGNPVGMFPSRGALTALAQEMRARLGLQ